jgi:fibronectin-binding autotransporter adhesin
MMRQATIRRPVLPMWGLAFLALLAPGSAQATDGTWQGPTNDWNTPANWSSAAVPDATATFTNNGAPTSVTVSSSVFIKTIQFAAGAPLYSFTIPGPLVNLIITGTGIVNSSSNSPSFTNDGALTFSTGTAGNATIINNGALTGGVGFFDSSTAGNANITNNGTLGFNDTTTADNATITNSSLLNFRQTSTAGSAKITNGSNNINFFDFSRAGNATITNNGSVDLFDTSTADNATINNVGGVGALGGVSFRNTSTAGTATLNNSGSLALSFFDTSSASSATIANTGGCVCPIGFSGTSTAKDSTITNNGFLEFGETSTAGDATITTNASPFGTRFRDHSTGSNARFITSAGSRVDFSQTLGPAGDKKVSAGSIEGAGAYFLGSNQLTVGSNNLDTTVSGVISDCGPSGTDCINPGATGGSLVKVGTGTLVLSGTNTYAGGTAVNAGTLAGTGTIGNVTVASGGTLAPGLGVGTLSTGSVTFGAGAVFAVEIDGSGSDRLAVTGGVNLGGATLSVSPLAGHVHIGGTAYTIVANDGGDPVVGTFAGLPDGAIFTAGTHRFTISYHGGDGNDVTLTALVTPSLATGADAGGGPHARLFDPETQLERFGVIAFDPVFPGGVRVAVADLDGDGIPDLITGAGPGGGPHVRVFDGATGAPFPGALGSFFAFDPAFAGGVYVAAGYCDGAPRLVVGAGAGGGPHVKVFDGQTGALLASFFAYDVAFPGGVRVAAGDVNGDGCDDIVTGAGPGGGPHVEAFDGRTLAVLRSFMAYDASFTGGVYVAAGDVDGDGRADVVTGAGAGGGPHVKVFSGQDGALLQSFFAFDAGFSGGVRVGAVDVNGDGRADIVAGAGPGGGPHVRVFNAADGTVLWEFFAYDAAFSGGVFVGAGR